MRRTRHLIARVMKPYMAYSLPISKGNGVIIIHAGSEEDFVPKGDYHHDMDYNNYIK